MWTYPSRAQKLKENETGRGEIEVGKDEYS